MIHTEILWTYIMKHSVRCYEYLLQSYCVDTKEALELEHYTSKTIETDKLIHVHLSANNAPLLAINRGYALEYGNPPFTLNRINHSHNFEYIEKENMYMAAMSVTFKYWKDSGTIDIVVNRRGLTNRWNQERQEVYWKWRVLKKTLKIKRDNVYILQGKRIRCAMFDDIIKMLFTIHSSSFELYFDGNLENCWYGKRYHNMRLKVRKIQNKLLSIIYGKKDNMICENPFSVAKSRAKNINTTEEISYEIHKFFRTPKAQQILAEGYFKFHSVVGLIELFKRYKHKDIINTILTLYDAHKSGVYNYRWVSPLRLTHDFTSSPCNELSCYLIAQTINPLGFSDVIHKKDEKVKIKRYKKIGYDSDITKENCHLFGLEFTGNPKTDGVPF